MNSRISIFVIIVMCFLTGCKQSVDKNSINTTEAEKLDIPDEQNEQVADTSIEVQRKIECHNGSIEKEGKCVCDDGSEHLGEGWYCLTDGQRCMNDAGCFSENDKYVFGIDYRNGSFYCGKTLSIKNAEGYYCQSDLGLICRHNQKQCICGNKTISSGDKCVVFNSIKEVQKEINTVAKRIETIANCEKTGGYFCEHNVWMCEQNLIPAKKSDSEGKSQNLEMYCEGIALSSIGQLDEIGKIYRCRYGHWVCYNKEGCSCFDGNENQQIQFGDICENSAASCKDANWLPNHLKITSNYDEDFYNDGDNRIDEEVEAKMNHADICLNDHCPCGDGACMKFGICKDGICSCGNIKSNLHDEFICSLYHQNIYLGNSEHDEVGGILICSKPEGCHTLDGRHYPQWATIGFNGYSDKSYPGDNTADIAYHDALQFHIDAGFDTTVESTSPLGECVLDRQDGLLRQALADGSDSFVCDQNKCVCGDETCKIGEICEQGKCRDDNCRATNKTQLICDVNWYSGQRSFQNPKKKHECIIGTDEGRFSTWYYLPLSLLEMSVIEEEGPEIAGDFLIPATGMKYYDNLKCNGGHRYCHGRNNAPILAPQNLNGYECQDVPFLPTIEAKDHLKAWVCTSSSCACGKASCNKTDACIDGACISFPKPDISVLQDGYIWSEDGQECSLKTCTCGDMQCQKGELCSDGHCLMRHPHDNDYGLEYLHYPVISKNKIYGLWECKDENGCTCYDGKHVELNENCTLPCYGDTRISKDGCWCGDSKLNDTKSETCFKKDEQYLILCNDPKGCTCGETKCPMSTYCAQNQCLDPLTGQAVAAYSNKLEPVTSCHNETCVCAQDKCQNGQFCLGGICRDNVYARIKDGQRIFYNFDSILSSHLEAEYAWNEIQTGLLDDWSVNDLSLSEYMVTPFLPQDYNEYYEEENYFMTSGELRCSLADGCACGLNNKCLNGAECIDGKCIYDDNYINIYCTYCSGWCNGDPIEVKDSYCYCHETVHQPALDAWNCSRDGWECNQESGCACGDVLCSYGGYCIKPGVCTKPANK